MRRILIALPFLLLAVPSLAADGSGIDTYLDEHGQLDLDALRASGFEGALELEGTDLVVDPETGRPILAPLTDKTNSDEPWAEGFYLPGFDGSVEAICVYDGCVYVGGMFRTVGSVVADNLVYYDGVQWRGFEESFGYAVGQITCMTVFDGELVIGGDVTAEWNSTWSQHIVSFDGTRLRGYLSGFSGRPYAMLVMDGQLIAGGNLWYSGDQGTTFKHLARWTGNYWMPYGTGMNGVVQALCELDGDLIIGGNFSTANGVIVNGITRWNGTIFEPLSTWTGTGYANVKALLPLGDDLYVGGEFSSIEGRPANNFARWNGSNWFQVGGGITSDDYTCYVETLHEIDGDILVGGRFQRAGSLATTGAVLWDGSKFNDMAGGVDKPGYDGGLNDAVVWNGDVWAVGWFTRAGDQVAHSITLWDGAAWSSAPETDAAGIESTVMALCLWNGDLIAGGRFRAAGRTLAEHIARWDGDTWHPLGTGLDDYVTTLAVWDGDLIAGGEFLTAGGTACRRIARWDGAAWHDLAGGLDETADAMIPYDGNLYVGGDLVEAGGVPVNHIAVWDGLGWSEPGGGVDGRVHAFLVVDDDLLAGGEFLNAGGTPAAYMAAWDGATWSEFGNGADGNVYALAYYNGVVAGGEFLALGGVPCSRIGRWNGATWDQLGAGFVPQECWMVGPDEWECWNIVVADMVVCEGRLFVNGITRSGSLPLRNLACWTDVEHWTPLGSGLPSTYTFCADDQKLWVGGGFIPMTTSPAHCIVSWDIDRIPVDSDENWWAGFDEMGTDKEIGALCLFEDELVAGGYFTDAGGTTVGRVASWDGSSWTALGDGLGKFGSNYPRIRTLLEWNGALYACGLFSVPPAPTTEYASFARWNGSAWESLMDALWLEYVYDIVPYGDDLVLIGGFTEVEGQPAGGLALYDGADFTVVPVTVTGDEWGGYLSGGVVYEGDLVVYGDFETIDGIPCDNLARWTGSAWLPSSDGFGTNNQVTDAVVNGGALYVGGMFTVAGGVPAGGVARWSGLGWDTLGGGLAREAGYDPQVKALGVYGEMVVAAGYFDLAAGQPCSKGLVGWDGAQWQDFGSGFFLSTSATVKDFAVMGPDLYVAGSFNLIGDKNSKNIARWLGDPASGEPTAVPTAPVVLHAACPNPFNAGTTLRFDLTTDARVALTVHDMRGRLIRSLVDADLRANERHEVSWDGRDDRGADMPSGLYLVRLVADEVVTTGKMLYVR